MAAAVARAKKAAELAASDPETAARLEALAAHIAAEEREDAMIRREEAWATRGVPRRLWDMFHASVYGEAGALEESPALQAVGPFVAPAMKPTLLVLAGGVGTGKSVAAAWACAFNTGRFIKAIDLIRAGLFDDDEVLPPLIRAPLIAIDDLGMEPIDGKGYGYAALYDLLDRRYDAGRKTIVTTNLTMDQFRDRYGTGAGERLWDRVREVGIWVDIPGASLRRRAS